MKGATFPSKGSPCVGKPFVAFPNLKGPQKILKTNCVSKCLSKCNQHCIHFKDVLVMVVMVVAWPDAQCAFGARLGSVILLGEVRALCCGLFGCGVPSCGFSEGFHTLA